MDSMEVNKAIAGVLVAGIAFMVSTLVADGLVHPVRLEHSAIQVEGAAPAGAPAAAPEQPFAALLASADLKKGEKIAHTVCAACHTFNEGEKAGIGPNLYGVVGAPHGHMAGFDYSSALKDKKGPWTFDELNEWLTSPSKYAPGTKMTFPGLSSEQQRADVVAYLRTLSHTPEPLPPVPAQKTAAAAPAAGAAPAKPAAPPIGPMIAAASPAEGEKLTQKYCTVCHSFNKGGKAIVGPNLYGVLGAPHGHMEGFNYSTALKSKKGPWTYDELNAWLTKPAAYAPGTLMGFPGLPKASERAAIIAYLRTLSDKPEPLPAK